MTNKKTKILLCFFIFYANICYSQEQTPAIGIKTNLLSDVMTTLHIGGEMRLADKITLDLSFSYNPWTFSDDKKIKQFLFQPEVRYWTCEPFNRHFVGFHAHTGLYNIAGVGTSDYMKNHRFEGWLTGAGISYGYHWILSARFALEATIGLGYAYLDYDVFSCEKCGEKLKNDNRHYFGPTKVGVSLIYLIK